MLYGETTILLVEGKASAASSRKESLQKFGYRIFTAETGTQAAAILKENDLIDMVLIDNCHVESSEAINAAAEIQKDREIPIIFLSDNDEEEVTEKINRVKNRLNTFEEYRAYVEYSPVGTFICDENGKYLQVNNAASEITGYTKEELLSFSIPDLLPQESYEIAGRLFKELIETGRISSEFTFRHKDGSLRIWSLDAVKLSESRYMGKVVDITSRKRVEEKMAVTLSMLSSTMDSTADGILVSDLNGKIVKYNYKFREIWEFEDEIINSGNENAAISAVLCKLIEPEAFLNKVKELYTSPDQISFDVLRLKDGRIIERYSQPQRVATDIIGRVWSFRDVTEKTLAEQKIRKLLNEKEMILKEVHHRIKNNMNTLSSLLSLQASMAEESKAAVVLEDAGNRVKSLMVLYDKLYNSEDFREISVLHYLPSLIDEIIKNFPHTGTIIVEKEIHDFLLDTKQLQALGILANELITNIMKYAFADGRNGRIGIEVTISNNIVHFMIEDNGVGIPESVDLKNPGGFGLMLVNLLADQLRGKIKIERINGTRVILEFER